MIGILFLGTSHRGSEAAKYSDVLAKVINYALGGTSEFTGRLRTNLLETLHKDSESLLKLVTNFRNQTFNITIFSFVEQSATPPFKDRVSHVSDVGLIVSAYW